MDKSTTEKPATFASDKEDDRAVLGFIRVLGYVALVVAATLVLIAAAVGFWLLG